MQALSTLFKSTFAAGPSLVGSSTTTQEVSKPKEVTSDTGNTTEKESSKTVASNKEGDKINLSKEAQEEQQLQQLEEQRRQLEERKAQLQSQLAAAQNQQGGSGSGGSGGEGGGQDVSAIQAELASIDEQLQGLNQQIEGLKNKQEPEKEQKDANANNNANNPKDLLDGTNSLIGTILSDSRERDKGIQEAAAINPSRN